MIENPFSFRISIVFDDRCVKEGFLPGFGFAALIFNSFTHNYLLFDTGGNVDILYNNLRKLNVKATDINKVIISHNHYDHAGGLDGIYKENPKISIYVPIEHVELYKRRFQNSKVIGVSKCMEIEKDVYSSGQFGKSLKEQALFLKTKDKKIVILVGCTHPGLENFIIKAREISDIKAIIGGFHGFRDYSYLNDVEIIGACHCTANMSVIKRMFPKQFRKICVGTTLSF